MPVDEPEQRRFCTAQWNELYRKWKSGIAKRILDALEAKAADLNYRTVKLETGEAQREAVGFYKKNGYRLIDNFGEYEGCDFSICFGKTL
ncbi:GNAT family N-acetyltransferase [Paenibacillus arenilitoris]|uniref:GNAT family N-acetyltransferase n=1 Tax=Paenibacillus arenilitoris TaxID=2772299 RepID=A0A927CSM9_9BACL|nr:GNAT family N-acetyltransferase [Paenibacillus arenilitoris]MBD2871151.1 GNAT family N-acetyltransferase [Paenibacillus arenilitoris]